MTVHLYLASAKEGFATLDLDGEKKDMKPLFETIIEHIEAPEGDSRETITGIDQYDRLQ